ncbi:hypothetical protein [Jatrophihabitans sp.]|uniref:hypothetical protein n=1 Tax=Jatrophihabitans sp. TaxID=1932789 RepID=UPI002B74CAB9|nr:hypothetical protein [Jatrophihabitans sp.]
MSAVFEPAHESAAPARYRTGGSSGLSTGVAMLVIAAADLLLLSLYLVAFNLEPTGAPATLLAIGTWTGLTALGAAFLTAVVWRWRRHPGDPGGGNGGGGGPPEPGGWWPIIAVLVLTAVGIVVGFAVAYWLCYPAVAGARGYPGRLDALHAVHGSLSTLATLGEGVDPCPLTACLKPPGLLAVEMIQAVVGLVFLSGAVSLALSAVADRMRPG